jgi:hypothetical protein
MKTATLAIIAFLAAAPAFAADQPDGEGEKFLAEATKFLDTEVAAHLAAVPTLDPPPPRVLGVPTDGQFTFGSFMRALGETATLSGQKSIDGREVAPILGRLGLIEARAGGKTFAQLYSAITLREYGADLHTNPVWQSLTPAEQAEWRSLLDPARFYDRKTRKVINLPENYLGVAARIVALDYEMGLIEDRAFVDDVLERAAGQFLQGALYTDDNVPTGRYDRYSQEYARFVYEAAGIVGRKDIQEAVRPALHAVMHTWWDLTAPDGYAYPWGRTIGALGYMDTLDIVGFLSTHPEFRPAPLPDLAASYEAAWRWLQKDYHADRHLLDMFGFGRGNFSYMTPARQWQQTTAYLAKAAGSLGALRAALRAEKVAPAAAPHLPEVARFEWFRKGDRPAGVWLVREGALRFALPITTGTEAGVADYLPAPHGLPGFAPPVEQKVPALVPYLELADGRVIVAGDGADEIEPRPDGRGLRVAWRRWVEVVRERGAGDRLVAGVRPYVEPGLTTEVTWSIREGILTRDETISAREPITLRRFTVLMPSTGGRATPRLEGGLRVYRFESPESALEVVATGTGLDLADTLEATGDSSLGKGHRGAIPLVLRWEAQGVAITPAKPVRWTLRLRAPGK